MNRFLQRLKHKIFVLDGALGTMILKAGLSEADFRGDMFASHNIGLKNFADVLSLTRPEFIKGIHSAYLDAGADIISTNTFNANRLSLSRVGLENQVCDICLSAARIARETIEEFCSLRNIDESERPFVAGTIGPTDLPLSSLRKCDDTFVHTFRSMADSFTEQAEALVEGGADLIIIETVYDAINAEAACLGVRRAFNSIGKTIPVMISATVSQQGLLSSGEEISHFFESPEDPAIISVGLNCSCGAESLLPFIRELSSRTSRFVSLHPNAGFPDADGNYPDTPEKLIEKMYPAFEDGLINIVGGCCGTTPGHIRLIADTAARFRPRGVIK